MPKETGYYDLLGVKPTATPAEIKKAFRVLALKHHPDRAGNSAEATAYFQKLRAVHDVLIDAERREEYDTLGDTGTLHGGEAEFDADVFGGGAKLTPEDIAEYEGKYRNGKDEEEDLTDFYQRYDGKVSKVLEFIPYSDESDLVRFVRFWDAQIEKDELETSAAYKKARKRLLKRGKGKERDLNAEATVENGKIRKGKGSGGEADLVAKILARRQKSAEGFDKWAEGLGERAEQRAKEIRQRKGASKKSRNIKKKGKA